MLASELVAVPADGAFPEQVTVSGWEAGVPGTSVRREPLVPLCPPAWKRYVVPGSAVNCTRDCRVPEESSLQATGPLPMVAPL